MNAERLHAAARWARTVAAALVAAVALRLAYFAAVTTMDATESHSSAPAPHGEPRSRDDASRYGAGSGRPRAGLPRGQRAGHPAGLPSAPGRRVLAAAELALLARATDDPPPFPAADEILVTVSIVARGPRATLWAGDQRLGETPFLGQVRCRASTGLILRLERPGRPPSSFSRPCRSGTVTLSE